MVDIGIVGKLVDDFLIPLHFVQRCICDGLANRNEKRFFGGFNALISPQF
jgi:hypothetical protein